MHKKITFITLLFCSGIIFWLSTDIAIQKTDSENSDKSHPTKLPLNSIPEKAVKAPDDAFTSFTPAEITAINDWSKKHGYQTAISADGKSTYPNAGGYEQYDIDMLRRLMKNGDPIAAQLLGEQLIAGHNAMTQKSPQEIAEAENALIEATARGFTTSIEKLIELKIQNHINISSRPQQENDITQIIDAYAYFEILKIRRSFDLEYIEASLMGAKKLNPAEYATAMRHSEEIYSLLIQKRTTLGLGPFENNNSPETQTLLQRLSNAIKNGDIQ